MHIVKLKKPVAGLLTGLLLCSISMIGNVAAAQPAQSTPDDQWSVAWAAAPDSAGPVLKAQTVRQVIRTSVAGSSVRIRLSNLFGAAPVTIGPVHVALHAGGSAIRPGSDHALSFGGKPAVTIAKGESVLSDPVKMDVTALQELAVSMYLPTDTGPSTIHGAAMQTAYITKAGEATAATVFPANETDDSRYFLTDVEVSTNSKAPAIVIVGDSITDGVGSTLDRNTRWPDALATRLQSHPTHKDVAVVNSGIAGNRILNDGADPFVGPSAIARFERDALNKPGVRWVLLAQGINDISATNMLATPKDQVTAQQIIDGMKVLIDRSHAKGVKIFGATLLPYTGVKGTFFSDDGEAKRQLVNLWIRQAGLFDAVIDFEKTVRDPAHPERLLPAYDSGDHLHPNDAGYQAMAAAIDLHLLTMDK